MGINAGAQVAIILLACRPCVVIVDYWDRLYLGRAPRTKETVLDFREWCRVTRHPRVLRGLTGCQRTPREWGVTIILLLFFYIIFFSIPFFHTVIYNVNFDFLFKFRFLF